MIVGLFNPFNPMDYARAIVSAIGNAIDTAVSHAAAWCVGQLVGVLTATTRPDLTSWFQGPWKGMLAVGEVVALILLMVSAGHSGLSGATGDLARRAFISPLFVAVGTVASPAVVAGLIALVDYLCGLLTNVAIGGNEGFGQAIARLPVDSMVFGPGVPILVALVIVVVIGVASAAIWIEFVVRASLIYMIAAFIPVGLAGLFWKGSSLWLKLIVESLIGVIAWQLVITLALTLCAADLSRSTIDPAHPWAAINTIVTAVSLLVIGAFSPWAAMRFIPIVVDTHAASGSGTRQASQGARSMAASASGGGAGGGDDGSMSRIFSAASRGGVAGGLGAIGGEAVRKLASAAGGAEELGESANGDGSGSTTMPPGTGTQVGSGGSAISPSTDSGAGAGAGAGASSRGDSPAASRASQSCPPSPGSPAGAASTPGAPGPGVGAAGATGAPGGAGAGGAGGAAGAAGVAGAVAL